ncbi:MAG: fused MFS/spermidine synthase [Caldilineaceae bacterium]
MDHTTELPPNWHPSNWHISNRQALLRRLEAVRAEPDGTIYAELHGPYFVVVSKADDHLRLWLLDIHRPDSGVVQSEIALDDPLNLVDDYTQAAMLALLWQPQPRRVYVAGLGAGCVPLVLHHYFPDVMITCSEIEPVVLTLAERFFAFQRDARLQVVIEDGRNWLAVQDEVYDILFVDVFLDRGYVPYRMSTVEFYQLCYARLTAEGVLAINLLTEDPYLPARVQSLRQVFPVIFACQVAEGNTLLFASRNHTLDHATLIERAKMLQNTHHFAFPLATLSLDLRQQITIPISALDKATPFYDATPPEDYFAPLPSFQNLMVPIDPALPCPCGSGLRFGACHGIDR